MENHLSILHPRKPPRAPGGPLAPTSPAPATGRWYRLGRNTVWLERSSFTDPLDARDTALRQLDRARSWRPPGA